LHQLQHIIMIIIKTSKPIASTPFPQTYFNFLASKH